MDEARNGEGDNEIRASKPVLDADAILNAALRDLLPFESWERLPGESAKAYAAFCLFRDFGSERNIKRAMAADGTAARRYDLWRNWSTKFHWFRRAGDYDSYLDRLKRTERSKTIEQRETVYRAITERMLMMVKKRLDLMQDGELTQANVMEWLKGSIDIERAVLLAGEEKATVAGGNKQMEIRFQADFDGI